MDIRLNNAAISDEIWSLLLLADPEKASIKRYLATSKILVAVDDSLIVGVAVVDCQTEIAELKNIAVLPSYQGKGLAKQLIASVKQEAKQAGAQALTVGTGNSSLKPLALYQKCGFRITTVIPDYFKAYTPPIYENGIRCMDMIVLKIDL